MTPASPPTPATAAGLSRANWLHPSNLRAALRTVTGLVPTTVIGRGTGPVVPLPWGPAADLAELPLDAGVDPEAAAPTLPTLDAFLAASAADAFLVLHRGRVVYERYLDGMTPDRPHQWASMTKAVTGLLAAVLADAEAVDLSRPVAAYVPELADSPFGRATVQQNLDMEVA
ncbi:MAG: beta-lactamase family protein, partial [Phycisphaerales bacterium]|nr:beta-lactamase family protein [Phycisphaerales bacterium]